MNLEESILEGASVALRSHKGAMESTVSDENGLNFKMLCAIGVVQNEIKFDG